MARCILCGGSMDLWLDACPQCDGVPGLPDSPASQPSGSVSLEPTVSEMAPRMRLLAEQMRRQLPMSDPSKQLSVVSFNMLLKGFDAKPYYPSVPAEFRAWPRRRSLLLQLLEGVRADVYCMQEVECLSFVAESAALAEAGYAWVAPKDDAKGKYPDMAKPAFFYRADRLELLWTDHRSRVVLASFRHRCSGHHVYLASCHLEGAPWEAAKRIAQTKKALESLQRRMVSEQKAYGLDASRMATIFAGDFNEEQDAAVCHLLRTGLLEKSFRSPGLPDAELTKEDYSHRLGLSDLYSSQLDRPPTFCAPPEAGAAWGQSVSFAAVDFIFYSHASLHPVAIRDTFTKEQVDETRGVGIPSEWHFSDHVPVGAVFEFVGTESLRHPPTIV